MALLERNFTKNRRMLTIITLYKYFFLLSLGTLNKTAQDGDGNVGKTMTNYRRTKAHVNF